MQSDLRHSKLAKENTWKTITIIRSVNPGNQIHAATLA